MSKNEHAVALGKLRAKSFTSEQQAEAAKARWANLDDSERSKEMSRRRKLGIKRKRGKK